jgi:hypothetical protein
MDGLPPAFVEPVHFCDAFLFSSFYVPSLLWPDMEYLPYPHVRGLTFLQFAGRDCGALDGSSKLKEDPERYLCCLSQMAAVPEMIRGMSMVSQRQEHTV